MKSAFSSFSGKFHILLPFAFIEALVCVFYVIYMVLGCEHKGKMDLWMFIIYALLRSHFQPRENEKQSISLGNYIKKLPVWSIPQNRDKSGPDKLIHLIN